MSTEVITKECFRISGYETWYDLDANINGYSEKNNQTVYNIHGINDKLIDLAIPLSQETIKTLAKLELMEILKEANLSNFQALKENIQNTLHRVDGQPSLKYRLEYPYVIPETKEVVYKRMILPFQIINNLAQEEGQISVY